jgi:hypothetical protein
VVSEQVEERHRQVLAGGDGAPAADGVEADRDAVVGHQVRILGAPHGQLADLRVGLLDRLLEHLLLGRDRLVTQEIDGQVEEPLALSVGQHVLHRAHDALGLQVAAAHAEGSGVERRCVRELPIGLELRVDRAPGVLAVLQALADGRADLPHQGEVDRQRLIQPLEHADALLALHDPPDQVGGERPEHHEIDHTDLDAAGLAKMVGDRLGGGDQAALADDQVVGVVRPVGHHPLVRPPGELVEFSEGAIGQLRDVVEEERPLSGDALHVGVLVLDQTGHHGVVDIPEQRDPAPLVAIDDPLCRRRCLDHVLWPAQILGDQLALWHQQGFDQVGGQESVLGDGAGSERQLGDPVADDVQVGRGLGVLREDLKEAGVVDAVVVVVPGVHVQVRLGHGPGADVEHVGQPLSHCGVEGLVHVGDALAGREVGRPQARHGHARGHGSRRVLPLGLDEDQRAPGYVDVAVRRGLRPVLAHLGRRGDRIGAGGIGGLPLAHDDRGVAVHGGTDARVLEGLALLLQLPQRLPAERQYGHRILLSDSPRIERIPHAGTVPNAMLVRSAHRGARPCG